MMETYLTEEERLEAVQRWWKENKSSVFGGLLLGLAVVAGYKFWQGHRLATAEQASQTYSRLVEAVQEQKTEPATQLAERLLQHYPGTTYAEYARLFLARFAVDAGNLDGASRRLEEALTKGGDAPLQHLARLRLARVQLAKGEIEPALKRLEGIGEAQAGPYASLYAELRGDLLAAAGKTAEARAAYAQARSLGSASALLEMKLNDLPTAP